MQKYSKGNSFSVVNAVIMQYNKLLLEVTLPNTGPQTEKA